MIESRGNGVRFDILVTPRSSRNEVAGRTDDDVYRVRIKAPPVDGEANEAIVAWLARLFGVKKSAVRLVSGTAGRRKAVEIEGVSRDRARDILEGAEGPSKGPQGTTGSGRKGR